MANDSVFVSVIASWQRFGIFDFIIPFMLVFAIIYGVLERTELFGQRGPSVNAIIALAIAMGSVLTGWFVGFLAGFLPWVSAITIVVVCSLMLVAMISGKYEDLFKDKYVRYSAVVVVVILAIIFIAVLLVNSGVQLDFAALMTAIGLTTTDFWAIIFFVAFIAVIIYLGRQKTEEKKT